MEKIDYMKQLKHLYGPSAKKVEIVDVPEMNFLMIDGEGDPNTSQSFKDAVESLFSLSYTLKFMIKKGKTRCRLWCAATPSSLVCLTICPHSAQEIKTLGNGL